MSDRDKYGWKPEDVTVTPPCQAGCGRPADDPEIPGLCHQCATSIDRDYEWLRDLADLEGGP
jgi:hypothetical protein